MTPQSWANRLTKILSVHQAVHGLPRFPIEGWICRRASRVC